MFVISDNNETPVCFSATTEVLKTRYSVYFIMAFYWFVILLYANYEANYH